MTNQLLFGLQENADGGIGSLPLDTDDKYNAGGKVIKNLGEPTLSNEAVTKTYVDNMALYGSAFGGVDPQSWSFTAASEDISGNDRAFILTTPGATSTEDSMYLVEAGGVMQTPADYNVSEVGGTFTLTMLDAATGQPGEIADGTVIVVRNFGVSRNIIIQPLTAIDATDTPLTLKGFSGQAANLLDFKDNSDTLLASVDKDGDATFPSVTAPTVTASTSVTTPIIASGTNSVTMPNEVLIGAVDIGSTTASGAKLIETGDRGRLDLQQTGSSDSALTAFQVRRGADRLLKMDYAGNLDLLTGALQMAGETAMTIRQIVDCERWTGSDPVIQSSTESEQNAGLRLTITPKSASSKIIIFASIFSYGYSDNDQGGTQEDQIWYINMYKDQTEDDFDADTAGGTRLFNTAVREWAVSLANTNYSAIRTSFQYVMTPGNTTEFRLDITHYIGTDMNSVRTYTAADKSQFFAVEIG